MRPNPAVILRASVAWSALLPCLWPATGVAQDPAPTPQPPAPRASEVSDLPSLVRFIESRERRAKTVTMRLRTRG